MLNLSNVDDLPLDGSQGIYALRVASDAFTDASIHQGDIVIMRKDGQPQPGERAFVWLATEERALIRIPQPGDDVRARVISVIHHA